MHGVHTARDSKHVQRACITRAKAAPVMAGAAGAALHAPAPSMPPRRCRLNICRYLRSTGACRRRTARLTTSQGSFGRALTSLWWARATRFSPTGACLLSSLRLAGPLGCRQLEAGVVSRLAGWLAGCRGGQPLRAHVAALTVARPQQPSSQTWSTNRQRTTLSASRCSAQHSGGHMWKPRASCLLSVSLPVQVDIQGLCGGQRQQPSGRAAGGV